VTVVSRIFGMIVVCAVLVVAGCGPRASTGTPEPMELQLLVRGATPPTEQSFRVGDTVRIRESGTVLGTITGVDVEQSRIAVPDSAGVLRETRSPITVDINVTIKGQAVATEQGYLFEDEIVYVNNDTRYLTPLVQFSGIITEMRVVDAE